MGAEDVEDIVVVIMEAMVDLMEVAHLMEVMMVAMDMADMEVITTETKVVGVVIMVATAEMVIKDHKVMAEMALGVVKVKVKMDSNLGINNKILVDITRTQVVDMDNKIQIIMDK